MDGELGEGDSVACPEKLQTQFSVPWEEAGYPAFSVAALLSPECPPPGPGGANLLNPDPFWFLLLLPLPSVAGMMS